MSRPIIFLDLGGVILDKDQQLIQWQRLVGDYFVSFLGGTKESWIEAHQSITKHLLERERTEKSTDFVSFYRSHQLNWITGLFDWQRIRVPKPEECLDLAYRAVVWISSHIQAALPNTLEAIHLLYSQGYTLHMASGSASREVAGYLEGMGVRHCFSRLYGADLINAFKDGSHYYRGLFRDADVQPAEALVVDDSAEAICWAVQAGARGVLVSSLPPLEKEPISRIGNLAELPAFLQ